MKSKPGRPKTDKKDKKVGISAKLHPSLIKRIKERADKESRSKNNIIEIVLDKGV